MKLWDFSDISKEQEQQCYLDKIEIVRYSLCCIFCNPLINSWALFNMQSAGNISVNILQACAFRLRGNPCDW